MKMRSALNVPKSITKGVLAIICSNSFSHCKGDQKKTVAISQMFNHVQLHVHWMHLLNTRICVCVCSNSRNNVPRVVQRYGTIAAHTAPCVRPRCVCSVLRAHVQFCRFNQIRRTPPPTFSVTAFTNRHSDTTIF